MDQQSGSSRFHRPEIIRPPSEWKSYYLPLTNGCSNNTCAFCNYYGCKLGVRDVDEVKQEIDALALYIQRGIRIPAVSPIVYAIASNWDGQRVFLQDGDALVYPYARLVEVLRYLGERLPSVNRVGTYGTPQDLLRRDVDELRTLKRLGLGIVYMGVESGDEDVLKAVGKGVGYDQIVAAGRKAKEAGIALSVTVILGLAGTKGSEKHALATARILTDLDPDYVGALTLTPVPGTPLYERLERGDMDLISPFQSLEELKLIVENAWFSNCFFSSMHASNYLSVRGTLPQDKEKVLAGIETALSRRDPRMLRPEFLRGL